MQRAQRPRQKPGRHQQDQHAAPAEKAPQVQPQPAPGDGGAHRDGEQQAGHRTDGRRRAGALPHDGEQENRRLQPFPRHGEEDHGQQSEAAPFPHQRGIDAVLHLRLHRPGGPPHPEDHGGQHADGRQSHHGLEDLLPALRELGAQQLQGETRPQADQHPCSDAEPDQGQPFPPPGTAEIARDQADDQGGFQPFPEHDEERNKHDDAVGPGRMRSVVQQGRCPASAARSKRFRTCQARRRPLCHHKNAIHYHVWILISVIRRHRFQTRMRLVGTIRFQAGRKRRQSSASCWRSGRPVAIRAICARLSGERSQKKGVGVNREK